MQNYIGNGVIVKLPHFMWKLEPPATYGSAAFKDEVAVIFKIQFKHAVIVLSVAGSNRLNSSHIVNKTLVIAGILQVTSGCDIIGISVSSIPVACERKLRTH